MSDRTDIKVVIVGAGGYSGAELVNAMLAHPRAELVGLFASARREKGDQPGRIDELFPRFRGRSSMDVLPASIEAIANLKPDAVFLATPHEASVELAPALLERGMVVLDLSAAFRLKNTAAYPRHYAFEHPRQDLLGRSVYGLPELNRAMIAGADLIAVPGCYPTSAILALRPLVAAGLIRPRSRVIIDATSGVSGAGRGLSQRSLFCEVSLSPYGVLNHRHNPEIDEHAGVPTLFTPHLGAFDRGILSTIHVELADRVNAAALRDVYSQAYGTETFIRLLPEGSHPSVKDVQDSNFCDLSFAVDESAAFGPHAIIFSALDNLLKGAAGQAVQCLNARFAMPEWWGLLPEGPL